ncbi:hypothetical protein, partial [Nocardioides sp.]|uniref:hypothetical protein n=1 Tax=Nocardioides sp. TaxID=35761 RepID=UPI002723E7A3
MSEQTSGAPTGTWSYRPGSWFGVFGAATTLLLPASEKARVADLWSRIDDGADFDAVLDVLLQSGLGVLPGFVLVGGGDGPTKILVRGASVTATVTAGDATFELDGSTVTTWVERTLPGVTGLSVTVDGGDPDSDDLPIHGGLVRVGRVDQPPYVVPAAEPAAEPEPAPVVAMAEPADAGFDLDDAADVADPEDPIDPVEEIEAPFADGEVIDEVEPADADGDAGVDPVEEVEAPLEEAAAPAPWELSFDKPVETYEPGEPEPAPEPSLPETELLEVAQAVDVVEGEPSPLDDAADDDTFGIGAPPPPPPP